MFERHVARVALEHYENLLHETKVQRLIQENSQASTPPIGQALSWLGGQLVILGSRLQKRYDALVETPVLRATDQAR